VDYASEASWNRFWGLKIFESDVELGSWEFTKGYMAWRTFTVDVKDLVAGRTVRVKIGGVISSASRWFIDNVRIRYDVKYPFITVTLDASYPAHQWGQRESRGEGKGEDLEVRRLWKETQRVRTCRADQVYTMPRLRSGF